MTWGLVAGAAISVVGGVIASGNAEDAQNNATAAQSAAAASSNQLGQDQLAWDKTQYYDEKPLKDQTAQQTLTLMQQQGDLAKKQSDIASDYDAYNKGTFRPLEQKIVADAEGYDTPERRQAAQAAARADVEGSYDAANAGLARSLARTGVSMGSGRNVALMQDASLAKAGAIAGATTGADRYTETQGHARMMDAANLGRNLPSAQATAAGTSTGASNSATNAGSTAINELQAGIPAVNAGYAGAMQGSMNAGQLYGQASRSYGSIADAYGSALGGFGKAAGQIVPGLITQFGSGSGGGGVGIDPYGYLGGAATAGDFSSKKLKKNTGRKLSGKKALAAIEDTPVHEGWQYDPSKGGPDDGGVPHDGPMAEDVQANMGDEVAPGGKMIDRVSMNGQLMAGMQELSKRVGRIEKQTRKAA